MNDNYFVAGVTFVAGPSDYGLIPDLIAYQESGDTNSYVAPTGSTTQNGASGGGAAINVVNVFDDGRGAGFQSCLGA